MKYTKHYVWFSNGDYEPQCVEVYALNRSDAVILAKAERIMAGLDRTLLDIKSAAIALTVDAKMREIVADYMRDKVEVIQ